MKENSFCARRKAEFIADLEKQLHQAKDSHEAVFITDKIHQLQEFTPAEVMMYDLTEKNPATKDMIEYRFGKETGGRGYYDGHEVFEIRLAHASPADISHNHAVFINELEQNLQEYGIEIDIQPHRHINFSFWKGPRNLMDIDDADHVRLGGQIAEGVNKALYDGTIFLPYNQVTNDVIGTGAGRNNLIRLAKERLEIRTPLSFHDQEHPEAIIALVLAGAQYGLMGYKSGKEAQGMIRAVPVTRQFCRDLSQRMPCVSELYNIATRHKDEEHYRFPSQYILSHLSELCEELGIGMKNSLSEQDLAKKVEEVLHSAKRNGKRIIFSHPEAKPSDELTFEKEANSFEISPSYNMPPPYERVISLQKSNVLRDMFSQDFYKKLCASAEKNFDANSPENNFHKAFQSWVKTVLHPDSSAQDRGL